MSDAIADALIFTLADIHARADVSFDLDSAISVLESAQAMLQTATPDKKRHLQRRAEALAAQSQDADFIAFLAAFVEGITDTRDDRR